MSGLKRYLKVRKKSPIENSDDEETSLYGHDFLAGDVEESSSFLRSHSSSEFDEETTRLQPALRETLPPNGDLYYDENEKTESTALLPLGLSSENSGSTVFYETNTKLVSFADRNGGMSYSTIDQPYAYNGDDDDDLSYGDGDGDEDFDDGNGNGNGNRKEKPFELSDEMLKDLRAEDSLFFNDKQNVKYRDRDHFGILTQMHGSVWKHVFPFCIFNVLWCFVIDYADNNDIISINIPSSGHSFMSILVSFLVVARVQFTYARFMEARGYLDGCFNNFRELMQNVSVLTMNSTNTEAKQWREAVAISSIATIRVVVAAVEFSSAGVDPYEVVPEHIHPKDLSSVEEFVENNTHFQRTVSDNALRAPLVFAHSLRHLLLEPKRTKCLGTNKDLVAPEQLKLLSFVTNITSSVHGLNKLITTPFSFPLVQMSRTILFFWVFTLPMAIMTDTAESWQIAIIVFFVTYGFIGLEYVSIELDDPFGNDPNDFDSLRMAQGVYEDVYLTLYQMDGKRYAESFRRKVSKVSKRSARDTLVYSGKMN